MSEAATTRWSPVSAWVGVAQAGRFGAPMDPPGVHMTLLAETTLATIVARVGRDAQVDASLRGRFGLGLPLAGKVHFGQDADVVWSAPAQWLLVAHGPISVPEVVSELASVASVTDQSDARALVRIGGSRCRDTLAKGVSIDLHPSAFSTGSAASTSLAHLSAQLWQDSDAPTYVVAVPRSFAGSFWSWLTTSAAEYGYVVTGAEA